DPGSYVLRGLPLLRRGRVGIGASSALPMHGVRAEAWYRPTESSGVSSGATSYTGPTFPRMRYGPSLFGANLDETPLDALLRTCVWTSTRSPIAYSGASRRLLSAYAYLLSWSRSWTSRVSRNVSAMSS
ncbi:hypothetical protein CBL_21383, partial [Carabus blaptoides fortunei]